MKGGSVVFVGLLAATVGVGADLARIPLPPPPADVPQPAESRPAEQAKAAPLDPLEAAEVVQAYPIRARITGTHLPVRAEPDKTAAVVGWVRVGAEVRLGRARARRPGCASGWSRLYPRGWLCRGQGVSAAGDGEPAAAVTAADRHAALPYRYYATRERQVPEYHRLPSRAEQRAAAAHAAHYLRLVEKSEARAARFRARAAAKKLRGGEPLVPAVVARFLHRGFVVAGNGRVARGGRHFVRTVRGSFVQAAQLRPVEAATFSGVPLGEGASPIGADASARPQTLPVAWAVRAAQPLRRREGRHGWEPAPVEPYERLSRVPWLRKERIGGDLMHVLEGGYALRHWFAAVAQRRDPPPALGPDEPWVHIDKSEQTLVLYRGAEPTFATLVSSGMAGHETPTGRFRIRKKLISDTMSDLGATLEDAYRIEDVPYAQYFAGSIALHGAFWHGRFGLPRSHGCVNLSPRDARYVFSHTQPTVPPGWHGVLSANTMAPFAANTSVRNERLTRAGTLVWVTE